MFDDGISDERHQRERSPAGIGLYRHPFELALDPLDLPFHSDRVRFKVHVVPGDPQHFTTPEPVDQEETP
ncbi:hypothetical protein GCM10010404_34280 [Nonomuraea africana]|uniref:Uncharacterized protein n=1 Tax=Nonomuraea africana TaxID=46171 RepID=A0ABR9KQU8_9ACTN|nr:hypothetical protein [Nonomuraea africana]MBE1564399.1 hypothetical protein [Nonomuraea africana]